ncbi:MAG: adenylate/guanylate cyclase domain-containing protein [Synergistaceae bacterium]|jgi:adenylate cyclase|nr:adenylate/guanylate cyclase domain-containing protein [Synergistaceae bacterium]
MSEKKRRSGKAARRRVLFCAVTGFLAVLFMLLCHRAQPRLIRYLDLKVYDLMLTRPREKEKEKEDIPLSARELSPVLVDIDDGSLAAVGQWPWPRTILAELLARIAEGGAAAIGVDILMPEPDRTSLRPLLDRMARNHAISPRIEGVPDELMDNDVLLADVLRQIPVVLSTYLYFSSPGPAAPEDAAPTSGGADSAGGALKTLSLARHRTPDGVSLEDVLLSASEANSPVPVLLDAVRATGFMNNIPDEDGLMRRALLLANYRGKPQASLALAVLLEASGRRTLELWLNQDGIEKIRAAGIEIPLSGSPRMPLAFRGPSGTYPVCSAADVLEGRAAPDLFAGKIVFVGSTAPALLDIRATPFDSEYAGLEMNAAVVDTILSRRFVTVPSWEPGLQVLLIAFFGLIGIPFLTSSGPLVYLLVSIALFWSTCCVSWLSFQRGLFFSPVYVLLTLLLESVSILLVRFLLESREHRALVSAFSNYVAPEVVARIARGEPVRLEGEEREISVLFTDIRSFTAISEKLRPQEIVSLLNRYFSPMTTLVRQSMGTVDKFVGDAMMAFWNAPLDVRDHPALAVSAVLKMHRVLPEINDEMERDFGLRIRIGAGLHCGAAHVGNMGTEDLVNYTAIGDTVNLASRLEGMCPHYGVGLVVSDAVAEKAKVAFYWKKLDKIRVKGRRQPVDIFTPLPLEEARKRKTELELWDRAYDCYAAGRFGEAGGFLAELRANIRKEGAEPEKLYEMFETRCLELAFSPPREWDGVRAYEVK